MWQLTIFSLQSPLLTTYWIKKITIVGTVRKNKKFLPLEFQNCKGDAGNAKFLFQEKVTLLKYNPKKNKSAVLLSTMHHDSAIDEEIHKPEIISFYNSTKGGVDTLDQIIRCYSSKRKTNRWPVALFFNMLDIAAYNSFLLYTNRHPEFAQLHKKQSMREFIKLLTDKLLPTNEDVIEEPAQKRGDLPPNRK